MPHLAFPNPTRQVQANHACSPKRPALHATWTCKSQSAARVHSDYPRSYCPTSPPPAVAVVTGATPGHGCGCVASSPHRNQVAAAAPAVAHSRRVPLLLQHPQRQPPSIILGEDRSCTAVVAAVAPSCCGRGQGCGCGHSASPGAGCREDGALSAAGGGVGGVGRGLQPCWIGVRELLLAAILTTSFSFAATASQAVEDAAAASVEVAAAAAASNGTAAAMLAGGAGAAGAGVGVSAAVPELAEAGVASVVPPGYVPSPLEPGWEIWLGFVAGVAPFIIGSYEFGKRIIIQLRCEQCGGRGLVSSSGPGREKYLRKCPQCGGFFPWVSWRLFLTSTAAPGNGGPLQQPRGQTSVFYSVPTMPDPAKQAEALARSQAAVDALQVPWRSTGQQEQEQLSAGSEEGTSTSGEKAARGYEAVDVQQQQQPQPLPPQ